MACNAFVAMLVFADDTLSPDRLEDYARLMYREVARRNLPAWVIGAPLEGSIPGFLIGESLSFRPIFSE